MVCVTRCCSRRCISHLHTRDINGAEGTNMHFILHTMGLEREGERGNSVKLTITVIITISASCNTHPHVYTCTYTQTHTYVPVRAQTYTHGRSEVAFSWLRARNVLQEASMHAVAKCTASEPWQAAANKSLSLTLRLFARSPQDKTSRPKPTHDCGQRRNKLQKTNWQWLGGWGWDGEREELGERAKVGCEMKAKAVSLACLRLAKWRQRPLVRQFEALVKMVWRHHRSLRLVPRTACKSGISGWNTSSSTMQMI